MTNEEQNIAVAEAMGWIRVTDEFYYDRIAWIKDGNRFSTIDIPNYGKDLNAMHEAEIVLLGCRWQDYESHLRSVTLRDGMEFSGLYERIIRATACQRREAFLKCIGKWREV